jgi:membrane protease YdiL (CAAX protease family)
MPLISRLRDLVTESLDAADASTLPPGRLSPRARTLTVFTIGSLVLTAMSYGVLNADAQNAMATALIDLARTISPDLGDILARYRNLLRIAMWTTGALTFYFFIPALIIRHVFGHRLRDYGLNLDGFGRHLKLYLLFFLPVAALVFVVAKAPDFQAKYPLYKGHIGLADLLVWELLYGLQFFALEFFFRGFLIHGVKDRAGALGVLAMVMPYVMIHFSKPLYETLGAVIAGTVLGLLSLRTGSIAGGVLIHVGVAWTMDLAALVYR